MNLAIVTFAFLIVLGCVGCDDTGASRFPGALGEAHRVLAAVEVAGDGDGRPDSLAASKASLDSGLSEPRKKLLAAALDEAGRARSARDRALAYAAIAAIRLTLGDATGAHANEREVRASTRMIGNAIERAMTFCEIAALRAYAGDLAGARESLMDARTASDAAVEIRSKAFCLRLIAAAQARAGDLAAARKTGAEAIMAARQAADTDEKASAALAIVRAQAGAGDIAGARLSAGLISEEDVARSKLAEYDRLLAFGSIAVSQAGSGDISGARATMSHVGVRDSKPDNSLLRAESDAWGWIAAAQAKSGDTAGANETVARIADGHSKGWAYLRVASARVAAGDRQGARVSLAAARTALEKTVYQEDTEAICVGIAETQTELGDIAEAKATAAHLRLPKAQAATYSLIVKAQQKAGNLLEASQTLDEAKRLVTVNEKGVSDPEDRASACIAIGRASAAAGDAECARALMERAATAAASIGDGGRKARAYVDIAEAEVEAGDVAAARASLERAAGLTARITDSPWRVPIQVDVATLYAKAFGAADSIRYVQRATDDPAVRCLFFATVAAKLAASKSPVLLFQ